MQLSVRGAGSSSRRIRSEKLCRLKELKCEDWISNTREK